MKWRWIKLYCNFLHFYLNFVVVINTCFEELKKKKRKNIIPSGAYISDNILFPCSFKPFNMYVQGLSFMIVNCEEQTITSLAFPTDGVTPLTLRMQ